MARFSNHSLKIHTTAESSAVTIGLIGSLSIDRNDQMVSPEVGDPYEPAHLLVGQQPEIAFTTCCLRSMLDNVSSLLGKCVTSDGSHPGVVAYMQKHDQCGTNGRASGSNHMSRTVGLGHLFIESISGSRGGLVMVSGRVHGITSDGLVNPVTTGLAAALPTGVVNNEVYGIGKAVIGGTTIDRIASLSMNFNPQFEKSNDADSIWPSLIDPQMVKMVTQITTEDPAIHTLIPPTGLWITHANSELYFLKRTVATAAASGGAFADFDTSVHTKGSIAGFARLTSPYSASGSGTGTTTIEVLGFYDGTNAPVVWDTTFVYAI